MPKEPTREEIEVRAYELYAARGYEDGHDLEDWAEAERQLREAGVSAAGPSAEPEVEAVPPSKRAASARR